MGVAHHSKIVAVSTPIASEDHAITAAPPPAYAATINSSPFACISLHMYDRIRLLQFPDADIARIEDLIARSWPEGVNSTRTYNASYEIRLKGSAWTSVSSIAPKAKKLLQCLMVGLYEMGWESEVCFDFCKKEDSKDTMIFRRRPQPGPPAEWLTISAVGNSALSIYNGPADFCNALSSKFSSKGWSRESAILDDCMEIRFKSLDWLPNGEDTVLMRLMMLSIVETLEEFGFRVYASVRAGLGSRDLMICCRERTEKTKEGDDGQLLEV